jgi:histidinol-phosphatase (PHP family)
MLDAHVHFHPDHGSGYTQQFLDGFVTAAVQAGLTEIRLLEHTHHFREFAPVYAPVQSYNKYQGEWLGRRMTGSIEPYLDFAARVRGQEQPVRVRFGLEVCYIPATENKLANLLDACNLDFLTGAVHWIDGWGFDHRAEFWQGVKVNKVYQRYYQIMNDLCESGLFDGVAHPDSIKCFGFYPDYDLTGAYRELAILLAKQGMFAENSGGLALNGQFPELGLNQVLLSILQETGVTVLTASDAHRQEDVGKNFKELLAML